MPPLIQTTFIAFTIIFLSACSTTNSEPNTKTIKETIPITMANIRGHESLYNEGWFVITSSKGALEFAKEHSIDNAKNALSQAVKSIKSDTDEYSDSLTKNLNDGYKTSKTSYKEGTQTSKNILDTTQNLTDVQLEYSKKTFSKAWGSLIKGNISLITRTQGDRDRLKNMGGYYFNNLKSDFSNLGDIASSITFVGSENLALHWENAFVDAKKSFLESYEDSGEADSSLGGLFHIMYGYLKASYHGVIKPSAKTVKSGADDSYQVVKDIGKLAYLPVGATISVASNTVESLGLTLYYTSSIGVKIVSPTIEAGFLSALSVLSLSSSGLTYIGGGTLGLVNQIGTTTYSPIAGVSKTLSQTAYDTTKLVTFVSYDVIKGSSKIFINEASAGVVLGYNALLALPIHTLLAASDSVFFLAWDGPRLVLAMAKGEIAKNNINNLPVGTVIDLQKLQKQEGVSVEIISKDYKTIEKVLHQLPNDMRSK